MRLLRSWVFVTALALAVGIVGSIGLGVGAKVEAEPALHMQARVFQVTLLAAVAWFALAIIRFWVMRREKDR